ncbi:CPBP family intramembrane glutamic endopeptidase [Sphingomonas sp. AX6]|uniref:CPBP family intramembrane glutamic endopeptidase n=1 Tax=Sphingomonas sp. AX6 TaxID=2653171 RepID=UPI0013575AF6|nr:CPBP family intramembrane glutamic endopeptidase [Sphingomonas sp. AX6]
MIAHIALTLAGLALYAWRLRGVASGPTQIDRYRGAMARSLIAFGAGGVALLALSGDVRALSQRSDAFSPVATHLDQWFGPVEGAGIELAVMLGFAGGVVVGGLIAWRRLRRGKRDWTIGQIAHLQPREPGAFGWAALLSIVAAVTEELFFRLVVPLLVSRATGDAWIGFAVALAMFAFAHRYQRWAGVAGTAIGGAFLTLLYLRTGTLWLPIAAHAAINLNGLVIRPWLARRISPSTGSRS